MPNKSVTVLNGDGSTRTITIPDRSRYAGRRTINSGYVYPANPISETSQSHFSITKTDDRNFRVFSDLAAEVSSNTKFIKIVPNGILRLGKQRITFDVTLNGSTVASDITNFMFRLSYRDDQTNLNPVVGSNTFDIDLYDDGGGQPPEIYFAFHPLSSYDISISNLKVTHEPREVTVDRTARVHTSDRKGQSRPLLSKVVGGAAAAYSLRDLNDRSGNNNVVRVRRESDNSEKDFRAKEVSNGTMARWVNEQPTLPLDLRELDENTGERDGALIQAAAAYSLRKLKEDFTGDVVEVRRNVDGETEGFTADEVTDGTLENFVEGWEEVTQLVDNSGFERDNLNFTYVDSRNFTFDFTGDNGFDYDLLAFSLFKQGKHRVTFDLTVNEGTDGNTLTARRFYIAARDGYGDTFHTSNIYQLQEGFNDITLTSKDNLKDAYPKIFFQALYGTEVNFDITISNLKVYESTVNELPLDQATGAAAAYSLRNLSSSGTDVTTSGDTAGDTTGKYVVQVRRSSDDAVQSFTASEVADGTLEDWVNADVTLYTQSGNLSIPAGSGTFANLPSYTVNNTIGHTFRISFKLKRNTGGAGTSGAISLRTASTWNYTTLEKSSNLTEKPNRFEINTSTEEYQTYSFACSTNAGSNEGFLRFQTYDSNDSYTVKDFNVEVIESNGHVRTWYDQSGSDNHAVQTTPANQPKIVDGGTLVADGIDFDGTQFLGANGIASSVTGTDQPYSTFAVSKTNTTATQYLLGMGRDATNTPLKNILYHSGGNFGVQQRDDANTLRQDLTVSAYSTGTTYLTSTTSSGTVIDFSKNGSLDLDDFDVDVGLLTIDKVNIGARANGDANPLNGSISELIIYNSDQSTKRRAIEENIANHYDISLAAFSRDGTVSTWYDQSGSTNDATQTDPTKQPKIVDGGTLLKLNNLPSIEFNGTDNWFDLTSEPNFSGKGCSIFSAQEPSYIDLGEGNIDRRPIIGSSDTNSNRAVRFSRDITQFYLTIDSVLESFNPIDEGLNLFSSIHNGTTNVPNVYSYANGTLGTQTDVDQGDAMAATPIGEIGRNIGPAGSFYFDESICELIIYDSDQSANRTAIEANIGEHYNITAIPAANDTVNGYVQTWYDQSGEGNDAVQNAAANQPKIVGEVTSGQPHAFLGALVFDGDDDFIKMDSEVTLGTEFYVPMVVTAVSADSETNGTFIGSDNSGGGNRFFLATTTNDKLSYRNNNTNFTTNLEVSATDVELVSYLATSSNFTTSLNGTDDVDAALAGSMGAEYIGGGTGFNLAVSFREIILYADDQSYNRPAIEANIANQYGITLS